MASVRVLSCLFSLSMVVAACGGGGGGGGAPAGLDAGVSLTGPWKLTNTTTAVSGVNAAMCDPVGNVSSFDATLTQTGLNVVVAQAGEPNQNASLVGRRLTLTVTETDGDFRMVDTFTINFVANGTSATGTGTNTVTKISTGAQQCVETFSITAARNSSGGGSTVNVVGSFAGTETTTASSGGSPCDPVGPAEADDWVLVQTGNSVTWDTGDPNNELTGTLTGTSFSGTKTSSQGGVTRVLVRNVTFSADGSSFTGTDQATFSGGSTCTETVQITGTRGGGGGSTVNVVGSFAGTETTTASSGGSPCDPVGPAEADDWVLVQTGSSVTWDTGDPNNELTGTLTGTSFSGTKTSSQGGVTRVLVRNVTFSADGSSFTGTDQATFSGGSTCTETVQITGTRGGGGGSGSGNGLTVKLAWPNEADLDLFLQEAGGATVGFNAPSTTGGVFSGDQGCATGTSNLEETWSYTSPASGSWVAKPQFFQFCNGNTGPVSFTLTITKPTGTPMVVNGSFPAGTLQGAEMPTPFSL